MQLRVTKKIIQLKVNSRTLDTEDREKNNN